jgi:hypothetical protein
MKPLAITALTTLLLLFLSLQAQAQVVELTLNCEYESTYDSKTSLEEKTTGGFSAIVRMQTIRDGANNATIRATTPFCFDFDGSFNELQVYGDCERNLSPSEQFKATLRINRISGEFENTLVQGKNSGLRIYIGHCTPAKKLF